MFASVCSCNCDPCSVSCMMCRGILHLIIQDSTDICGAKKSCASVISTSEATWTTLCFTSMSFSVRVEWDSDPLCPGSKTPEADPGCLQVLSRRGSGCSNISWLWFVSCVSWLVLSRWSKGYCTVSFMFDLFKGLLLLRELVKILPVLLNGENSQSDCNARYALSRNSACLCFLSVSWWEHGCYCINHMH